MLEIKDLTVEVEGKEILHQLDMRLPSSDSHVQLVQDFLAFNFNSKVFDF